MTEAYTGWHNHDVMEVRVTDSGCVLVCRCGRVIAGYDRADVDKQHDAHFGIEKSRAQLHPEGLHASDS